MKSAENEKMTTAVEKAEELFFLMEKQWKEGVGREMTNKEFKSFCDVVVGTMNAARNSWLKDQGKTQGLSYICSNKFRNKPIAELVQ